MKKITFFLCALLISAMSFADTYSHTFAKNDLSTGSVTLSDVSWTTTMTMSIGDDYYGWDSNTGKGIQIGKSKDACTSYSLTTSHFADYIVTNVTVNASIASSGSAKMQVSVGGVDYIDQTALTTSSKDYAGSGSSSGEVVISFTNTAKAFYIKSISIEYVAASENKGLIIVDKSNVDFGKILKTQTINVTGQGLTSPITATLENGTDFAIDGDLTAEGGELTIKYIATEAGTHNDVLVLTSGDVTTEVNLTGEVIVLVGEGTKEKPYTVSDILALGVTDQTYAWVQGYIIGTLNSNNNNALETTGTEVKSNIVLADATNATDNYIAVQLPTGEARTALNVAENPNNIGAKVAVYGTLENYFSKFGVKNVSDYAILSSGTTTLVDNAVLENNITKTIINGQVFIIREGKTFTLMGQEVK